MSADSTRFLIGGVLLIHGLGHGGALGALLWMRALPNSPTGGWLAARTWLAPTANTSELTWIAMAFWVVALIGFVSASLSLCGVVVPGDWWRQLAIVSALVSLTGMIVFFGTWPAFNWLASLAVNLGVLFTQIVTRWPAQELFGR